MSQAIAYTPPDYVPPERQDSSWQGRERRSLQPIDRLSRSLNALCLEASDPYEIVAHLEALGYNSAEALARLGVDSHFELAQTLYERTPRRRVPKSARRRQPADWFTPLSMGMAFLVTSQLGIYDSGAVLAPAIVILIWSQVGSSLLSRARGELVPGAQAALIALLLWCGVAAIAGSWLLLRFGLSTLQPVLIWFGVAALLWSAKPRRALALPAAVGAALLVDALVSGRTFLPEASTIGVTAVFCLPLLFSPVRSALGWLRRHLGTALLPLVYGVAQGLMILSLLRYPTVGSDMLPGAVLLLGILLLSQQWLIHLKERLKKRLWGVADKGRYARFAQRELLVFVAAYLIPVALVGALELVAGPQAWAFFWHAFAMFGLCLGLAVVSFTLGDPLSPSLTFALAGVAALAGAPFILVCALTAATGLWLLLRRVRQVERYVVHLL